MAWFFSTLGNHVRSWGAPLTGSVRPCTLFVRAKAGCDCGHLLMGRSAVAMTCTHARFPRGALSATPTFRARFKDESRRALSLLATRCGVLGALRGGAAAARGRAAAAAGRGGGEETVAG